MTDTRPLSGASPSSPRGAAPAAIRPLVDALIQSSTVELFQSRNIAVAPTPSSAGNPYRAAYFNAAGVVTLTSARANGSLSLSWSDPVFSLFNPPVPPGTRGARDLLRELTNQLAGRVKNRLLNFALKLTIGVPTVLSGQAFERQRLHREGEVIYAFRTLRGEIIVTFDFSIEPNALSYSGTGRVAREGDFIPF